MSNSFTCPFCNNTFPLISDTYSAMKSAFNEISPVFPKDLDSSLLIHYYRCPNCNEHTIIVEGSGKQTAGIHVQLRPKSKAKVFPNYVPSAIRQDYEESYSILELSPKASATLSRRCIQGMIHDKWNIKLKNLNQEITALKDKIDPSLWSAIDALRQLGNIGAHMEKNIDTIVDIDPDESENLIRLVEVLINEWYIIPHKRNELLSGIVQINKVKQDQRKKTE